MMHVVCVFFFSSRRRHTRFDCDWSSDVCSCELTGQATGPVPLWWDAGRWVPVSAAEREEFLAGVHVGVLRHGSRHGGPDARRPGPVQLPARRPADPPPVAQGRSEGPTAGIGSAILTA